MESLYVDLLKPYKRILRKRLVERATSLGGTSVDIDAQHLHSTCVSNPRLIVDAGEGGEWSVIFADRPEYFVDVYSAIDVYPPDLWSATATYLEGLEDKDAELPGGRYSCAQALVARNLPFLQGYSLGQVCHIVQLAIGQKKILGYLSGSTVPYSRSQSMQKELCAAHSTNSGTSDMPIADWDSVRAHIRELLDAALAEGRDSIPISNIKRLFRSQLGIELSETALGHVRLSELLTDPRFRGTCTLQLQEHGYVVVPHVLPPGAVVISLADELLQEGEVTAFECSDMIFCADEPLCLEDAEISQAPKPLSSAGLSRMPAVSPATAFFDDGPSTWEASNPTAFTGDDSSQTLNSCGATRPTPLALSPSTFFFEDSACMLRDAAE